MKSNKDLKGTEPFTQRYSIEKYKIYQHLQERPLEESFQDKIAVSTFIEKKLQYGCF